MMINGIIFDADGTLIDSMGMWRNLGDRYLRSIGVEPEANLSRRLFAMSFEHGIEYLRERYSLEDSCGEIKAAILRMIRDFYVNDVALKPGVREILDVIRFDLKVPMTIATAGERFLLEAALSRLGILEYFSAIFTCGELDTSKHDYKIFLECAKFMGTEVSETLVFEDALFALEAAKRAGFFLAGVEDFSSVHDWQRIEKICDLYVRENDFACVEKFLRGE